MKRLIKSLMLGVLPALAVAGLVSSQTMLSGGGGGGAGLSAIANANVLANFSGSSAVPTANALPTCTGGSSALTFTGSAFGCQTGLAAGAGLGANTFTGDQAFSAAGAASAPVEDFTGAWFTGGSGTTTQPQIYIDCGGAASTIWNVNGTGIGINMCSGSTGNAIDVQVAGVEKFDVTSGGSANAVTLNAVSAYQLNSIRYQVTSLPVLAGSGLGTLPTVVGAGSGTQFITVGSSPTNATFTLAWSTAAAAHGWACHFDDETTPTILIRQIVGSTPTTVSTFQAYSAGSSSTVSLNASDLLVGGCGGG